MSPTVEGLGLSLMGITVTFAALGLLALVMVVLERLFRDRPFRPKEEELEDRAMGSTLARDTSEEEVVAAIAVALAHLHALDLGRSGLGTTLESGRGSWWMMGKIQQRSANSSHRKQGRR